MTLLLMLGSFEMIILVSIITLPLFALIDILKSKFHANDKLIWILIVLFANIFGTVLYLAIGRNKKIM